MNCDMAYLNMGLSRVWVLENLFSPKVLVSVIGKGVKHIVDTGRKACIRCVSFMADWLGEILVREHRIRRSRDYSFLTI